ncbi:hypothetical protein SAICODRAFT_88323 [Saitoella complicata NRRL Y-17804]|nr:uncharacterized protein SAICODRAFT_88323 [Saitoella complicata NRRL Y-17804]ODQ55244.1 hypothetical protein SAICODRAFT_88323 [Saitoella complicata NRRL Y-17804]
MTSRSRSSDPSSLPSLFETLSTATGTTTEDIDLQNPLDFEEIDLNAPVVINNVGPPRASAHLHTALTPGTFFPASKSLSNLSLPPEPPVTNTGRRASATALQSQGKSPQSLKARQDKATYLQTSNVQSPTLNPRRRSWLGGSAHQRTSSEIDREYDSDDSVPSETVLHNVPCSASSAVEQVSPDRSSMQSPVSLRNNSYADEMGKDARHIARALDRNRENAERESSTRPQAVRSISFVKELQQRKTTMTAPVPDPVPVSREKQKVLSLTRPSWLPPKSKDEEKRHLAEYERMMQKSRDSERKAQVRQERDEAERERMRADISYVWETRVLPNWRTAVRDPRIRELWWQGIPSQLRGKVWGRCFGNALSVVPDSFRLASMRANEAKAALVGDNDEILTTSEVTVRERVRTTLLLIVGEVEMTLPELKMFQKGGVLHEDLCTLLEAYVQYRSDLGYVPGMSHLAALMLLNMTPQEAFIALANLLNRTLPLALYTNDEAVASKYRAVLEKMLLERLPQLHFHLHKKLGLVVADYFDPVAMPLFSAHLPVDTASRLVDIYCFEGDGFLLRSFIACLVALEDRLYGDRDEVANVLGWQAAQWNLRKTDNQFLSIIRGVGTGS